MPSKWGIPHREGRVAGGKGRSALPEPHIIQSDNVYSYFRETQPSGTSLPANCLIWSHPQLSSSQPALGTAPPEHPHPKELRKDR